MGHLEEPLPPLPIEMIGRREAQTTKRTLTNERDSGVLEPMINIVTGGSFGGDILPHGLST